MQTQVLHQAANRMGANAEMAANGSERKSCLEPETHKGNLTLGNDFGPSRRGTLIQPV